MNGHTKSWVISVLAGLLVGSAGGFLALKALGAGSSGQFQGTDGSDTDGSPAESGIEYALDHGVERERLDLSSVAPGSSAAYQEELREAVSQALGEGRRTAIVNATEKVHSAVVTVFVTQRVRRSFFDSIFDDIFPYGNQPQQGLGSGVIVSTDGYILTNDHVVGNADGITVRFADGREFTGTVQDTDPSRDLAILKIDPPDDIPVAELGSSEDILIGEWIIALGSPFGFMLQDPQPSVSVGVVSAVGRSFLTLSEGKIRYFPSTIQTDAAINPGNSGGPLVNTLGEVVGINSFILTQSGGSVGIGFAIPINQAKDALEQVRRYGYIRKAWIGLQTDTNNYYYVSQGVINTRGAVILDVDPDSPADAADLGKGTLIVTVNGQDVRSSQDLEAVLIQAEIGDTVTIEYYSFKTTRKRTAELTIVEKPRDR